MIKNYDVCVFHECVQKYRKQPPEVLYKNTVLKNLAIFTEKQLCWSLFLIKRLKHGCFPVNIAKCLRTPILKNIWEEMLLCVFQYPEYCIKMFFVISEKTLISQH